MFSARFGFMDSGHWTGEYTKAEMPHPPQCGCLGGCTVLASSGFHEHWCLGGGGSMALTWKPHLYRSTKEGGQTWDSDALWGL